MPNQVKKKGRVKVLYWSLIGVVSALLVSIQPVMAETIWDRFSTIMKDFYGQLQLNAAVGQTLFYVRQRNGGNRPDRPHGFEKPAGCG